MLRLDRFFGKEKESFEFPRQTVINCETFNIEIIFSRKKNSSVIVKEDKLVFRLSQYLRNSQIKEHFNSLLNSITKKIEKLDIKPVKNNFSEILRREYFSFNDQRYDIEVSNKISGVRYKDNVFYYNPTLTHDIIEKRITKKLINLFEEDVEEYVRELNKRTYDYPIESFKLKNLDSKWGHCSSKNDIMLNVKLLNAEKEILDYVIIHELAHIKVKNHSRDFWREVERFCPDHKALRKELKTNPPKLLN